LKLALVCFVISGRCDLIAVAKHGDRQEEVCAGRGKPRAGATVATAAVKRLRVNRLRVFVS
jgi:hypothetical protein